MMRPILLMFVLAVLSVLPAHGKQAKTYEFDVVVYGGTAGGVATAIAAAREGATVALLEPQAHLGGMVSSGLGLTDHGKKEVIGGLSREFFERVGRRYREPITWHFEPHVAEEVFREMAEEARVQVFYHHRLREKNGVRKNGSRVLELTTENGRVFRAKIFADCSYEGDLMKQAGVSYTWGREGQSAYNESLAGVRDRTPYHQFTVDISPRDEKGRLLPEIFNGPKGAVGTADKKVQAYNFRLCLTDVPENRRAFPRPLNYDPRRFALLARMLKALTEKNGRAPRMDELMTLDVLKNRKTDTNNNGAFSTDYIGGSWDYPEADYKTREKIWREHAAYVAGFLYFLAHDRAVPPDLQKEVNRWGLAKDEFVDTDNWPHQLYVREARRMVGEYVMSQKDIQTELTKPDVIGMGSYNSDSHNVQRIVSDSGEVVENEGDMQVSVKPYQIPYRVLLPKRREATNLLVPVCFSASHVAYSTLRMEPQYLIIGQAAGVAAKMAIDRQIAVHEVSAESLKNRLRQLKVVTEWAAKEGQ